MDHTRRRKVDVNAVAEISARLCGDGFILSPWSSKMPRPWARGVNSQPPYHGLLDEPRLVGVLRRQPKMRSRAASSSSRIVHFRPQQVMIHRGTQILLRSTWPLNDVQPRQSANGWRARTAT
jgi:hypothetical protein